MLLVRGRLELYDDTVEPDHAQRALRELAAGRNNATPFVLFIGVNTALLLRKEERPARAGLSRMGGTGLEPVTPSLSSWCSPN
jgi:hypothetical protein